VIFYLCRRFAERFDALGAQRFLDQTTFFHDRYFLKIRFERAVGCTLGERTVMTEGGCFTAVIAFCHFEILSLPFYKRKADSLSAIRFS
jgi:hypothetical protein